MRPIDIGAKCTSLVRQSPRPAQHTPAIWTTFLGLNTISKWARNGQMGDGADSCDPCLRLCEPNRACRNGVRPSTRQGKSVLGSPCSCYKTWIKDPERTNFNNSSIFQNRSLQEFAYWKAWKFNFMNIWFTCASTLCRLIVMIKFTWCIKLRQSLWISETTVVYNLAQTDRSYLAIDELKI